MVREKHQLVASPMCPTRDLPATQAGALSGNRTSDLLFCGTVPKQQSHTGHGDRKHFNTHFHSSPEGCLF